MSWIVLGWGHVSRRYRLSPSFAAGAGHDHHVTSSTSQCGHVTILGSLRLWSSLCCLVSVVSSTVSSRQLLAQTVARPGLHVSARSGNAPAAGVVSHLVVGSGKAISTWYDRCIAMMVHVNAPLRLQ